MSEKEVKKTSKDVKSKSGAEKIKLEDNDAVSSIIDSLEKLNLKELLILEDKLIEKYSLGDIAANPLVSNQGEDKETSSDSSENSKVSLILEDLGPLTPIQALKTLNKVLKLSVSQAKEALSSLPYHIMKKVSREEAENIKNELNAFQEGLVMSIN